jgi:hypothetical protein
MAGVPALDGAASLLLLSRKSSPQDVAQQLAALLSEPALHGFLGWMSWIRDELIRPEPDAKGLIQVASPPDDASQEDYNKATRALGYPSVQSDNTWEREDISQAAMPTPSKQSTHGFSTVYSLAELQQALDALRYAQALRESLRPSASASTEVKRFHDATIWLKLLEAVLNPERLPPSPHHKFRGPPGNRTALEDLRDACYLIMGDFEELCRDRNTATRPTFRQIAPTIDDVVNRLEAGLDRYLKERPPLISCPHCYWMQELASARPNRPSACPRCQTVIRQPAQLPTDFQAAYSAADGLLRYCHEISDLARGEGDSRLLLLPRETWASTGEGMIRQLAEFLPNA